MLCPKNWMRSNKLTCVIAPVTDVEDEHADDDLHRGYRRRGSSKKIVLIWVP
jgi:hypothetical protein